MQRSTALTAAAALGVTMIAGVSAIVLTFDQGLPTANGTPAAVTQYVDQYGNPVDPPGTDTPTTATATVTPSSTGIGRSSGTTVRVGDDHESDEHEYEDD